MALFFTGDSEDGIALSSSGNVWVNGVGSAVTNLGTGFDFGDFANALIVRGTISSTQGKAVNVGSLADYALTYIETGGLIDGFEAGYETSARTNVILNEGVISGTGETASAAFFSLASQNNLLLNTGTMQAGDVGLYAAGTNNLIANTGSINANGSAGVWLAGSNNVLVNAGMIDAADGVRIETDAGQYSLLANFGTIDAETDAIGGEGDGATYILNAGTLAGAVMLGSGDDILVSVDAATMGAVDAGAGNDWVIGTSAGDSIGGGAGNDTISGGAGDDTIDGGAGADLMIGGAGTDTFVFEAGDDTATILDLRNDVDLIDLTSWGFQSAQEAMQYATINLMQLEVQFDFGEGDVLTVKSSNPYDVQDDIVIA